VSLAGRAAGNLAAGKASLLHASPFAALGRTGGFLQTARWNVPGPHGRGSVPLSLQYLASIFADPPEAAAAGGDARSALWESGRPTPLPKSHLPAFTVLEKRHHRLIGVVTWDGPVECELTLQIGGALDAQTLARALRQLDHAAAAVRRVTHTLLAAQPPSLPASVETEPPIAVAPWGTGPVVESPSLLVAPLSVLTPDESDPGSWRPAPAPLARQAIGAAALRPDAALSAFARTGRIAGTSSGLYDLAALYPDPAAAGRGLQTLTKHNNGLSDLRSIDPRRDSALAGVDLANAAGWHGAGETIVAVQIRNVLLVLASSGVGADLPLLAAHVLASIPSPLHAQGTQIVNAAGTPEIPTGLNWYGFDQQDFVPGGLDVRPALDILRSFKDLGYSVIRLPFSNQLVEQNPVVTAHLAANPSLQGLHALDIMDAIVNQAGALGLSVILDDHRSDAGWSAEENGLWYTAAYPDSAFVQDWATLAHRYAVNDVVIGADLRNEPHGSATWGDGNPATDWHLAAERAGDAVLAANPNLLILVEGVQFYRDSGSYWWGGNLMGVADAPIALHFADGSPAASRLVYSPHEYGPDNCGSGCAWFNSTTSYAGLAQLWDQFWGYISADPTKSYAAPVLVGEFGTCNYAPSCVANPAPGSQGQWFSSLLHYLSSHDMGWTYWSANGTQSTAPTRTYGALDWYGLFDPNWSDPVPLLNNALQAAQGDR
jgi:aryl-phospho-beta-D-glucosidase BglC (GH1 family)